MISCVNHDYVEIACLYRIEVKLILKNGQIVQGEAFQTIFNENREECILLKTEIGNKEIVLEKLALMEAITKNPHFEKVNFG